MITMFHNCTEQSRHVRVSERIVALDEIVSALDLRISHADPRTDGAEIERLTVKRDSARTALSDLISHRVGARIRRRFCE